MFDVDPDQFYDRFFVDFIDVVECSQDHFAVILEEIYKLAQNPFISSLVHAPQLRKTPLSTPKPYEDFFFLFLAGEGGHSP